MTKPKLPPARDIDEVRSNKGRRAYVKEGKLIAIECCECKEIKDHTEIKKSLSGFMEKHSRCKECERKYREKNRERDSEVHKMWAARNKNHRKEYMAKWREENADHIREYAEKTKERRRYTSKLYRIRNAEKIAEHRHNNRFRRRAMASIYKAKHPEKYRVSHANRRARLNELPNTFTEDEYNDVLMYFGGCALTSEKEDIQIDHVIPIATGKGGTTKENIVPLVKRLNNSKKDANVFEWFTKNKNRFNLHQEKFDDMIKYLSELNGMTVEDYRDYVYKCHEIRGDK